MCNHVDHVRMRFSRLQTRENTSVLDRSVHYLAHEDDFSLQGSWEPSACQPLYDLIASVIHSFPLLLGALENSLTASEAVAQ